MQKLKRYSKPLSVLMVILLLTVTSVKNSLAFGSYVEGNVKTTTSQELSTAGEPAAVAAALVVGAAFVLAAGVAFALGVYDGVHANLGEQLASVELYKLEMVNYDSSDFTGFDN